MRALLALTCLQLVVVLACERRDAAPAPTKSARAALASSAPSASQAAPPPQRPQDPVERFVMAWNSALDRHDTQALAGMYAPRVRFYGARKTVAEMVGAKSMAFSKDPDYHQRVGKVQIEKTPKGYSVRFEKYSGQNLASIVAARLVLEAEGDRLLIVEETDALTDKRFEKPAASGCYPAVSELVASLPAIEDDMRRVSRQSPQAKPGGILYNEETGSLTAAQGYFHSERFEPRWWIDVVKGELVISDALSGEMLAISEGQRAGVRQACGEPETDAGTPTKH